MWPFRRRRAPGDAGDDAPESESASRALWARAHGEPYAALPSLEAARGVPDAVVVLDGDWGGQIYVTCPVAAVRCDEPVLRRLLAALDALAWPTNDAEGASLHVERRPVGSGVPGGMGGAVVLDGPWVHPEFEALGLSGPVAAVLAGERETLPGGRRPGG